MAKKVEKAQKNAENAPIAKVSVELNNCYGIKSLKDKFDFTKFTSYAIYAPNGSMKSSFASTFNDIAEDRPSQDRIFKNRKTDRNITNNDSPIGKSQVLVVSPYDDNYLSHTEKVSTLLVNSELREEYEKLYIEVNKCKTTFLDKIKEQANSKKDIEKEISLAFTKRDDFLDKALNRIKGEVDDNGLIPFVDIKYDIVFDQKVIEFLDTEDFKNIINDYIRRYNELLGNSVYFKRGIFNYYNAETIAKNLSDNGFFEANHSVSLNAAEKTEISDAKQLKKIIADEKESIANDSELKKKFQKIEKAITKNVNLRVFQDYIEQREDILPQLANIEDFREKVIKAYIHENINSYRELLKQYETTEKRKKDIEAEADKQRTQWETVINEFNNRFFVPFKLNIKNKVQVILGQDSIPTLGFVFKEGEDSIDIDKTDLMNALSTGERKAFYILNVIFEIQARRQQAVETLLIFDDIADSFDYKNKYAIIQYLRDISEYPNFKMIILTHNFDFYRTIASRFIRYDACKMAVKNEEGITLNNAAGIRNIFINDWKPHFSMT